MRDRLFEELERAFDAVDLAPVEPTEEEKRNGWTTETLTQYLSERAAGHSLDADPSSLHRRVAERPRMQARYNPLKWRK